MTSTTLRDSNTTRDGSKESTGEMANGNQQRKAKTTRGDKFRGSDDEGPPLNTEPILVKKVRGQKGRVPLAAPRATAADQRHIQANAENWDESQGSVEAPVAQERFASRPPILAPRTTTTHRPPQQQEQEWSQASQHDHRFPPWQQDGPERPQQRQQQRPARPQQQVPQPRPPEQPWQQLRDARQQLEAQQVANGNPSEGTWQGEDPPNRVIGEDVLDNVHDRLDKLAWDKKPSAGSSVGAGASSTISARGGTAGFGPMLGRNPDIDSYIDKCIYEAVATAMGDPPVVTTDTPHRDRGFLINSENCIRTTPSSNTEPRCSASSASSSRKEDPTHEQPNRRLPQTNNAASQNSSRNQDIVHGHGQLGARSANSGPSRNAPIHGSLNTPNPPSWGTAAYAQWGQPSTNDWGNPSYGHNGHMATPNVQTNGYAPNYLQANFGASGSTDMGNTFASNAARQPPQAPRSSFPVSRDAAPPRRNGFGEYRGPTMRVVRKNGLDKLVRDGGAGRR